MMEIEQGTEEKVCRATMDRPWQLQWMKKDEEIEAKSKAPSLGDRMVVLLRNLDTQVEGSDLRSHLNL